MLRFIDPCRLLATGLLVTSLLGCSMKESIHLTSNIWGPSRIKRAEDARRIAAEAIDTVQVTNLNTADPRQWNELDVSDAWHLPLSEALAIGLSNSPIVRTLGPGQLELPANSARVARGTIFEPQIEETEIEAELGRFDARMEAFLLAHPEQYPPNTAPNGTSNRPQVLDRAGVEFGVRKPIVTGGEIGMMFDNDYRYIPPRFNRQAVNPQYQPQFELELSQPLLQGAGKQINLSPVIIVAAEAQQSAWELQAEILGMMRSVETVYWSLYEQRGAVRTIDRVIPMLEEAVRIAGANVRADIAIPADLAQAQTLLYDFQQRRVRAMTQVRQQESLLRDLIGLPPDSEAYILTEPPGSPEPPAIDWHEAIDTALRRRPDVTRQRLAVHVARLVLEIANNRTLPELDAIAAWRVKGLGEDLGEALDLLGDFEFNDWAVGFSFAYPLGNREARAQRRAAKLVVDRENAKLHEAVHAATHELSQIVYELDAVYREFRLAEQRQQANDQWLRGARARYINPVADETLARSLDLYLRAIRASAESEQELIILQARYRKLLAAYFEAQGTLLDLHNVMLHEDPRAKVDAMELELERLPTPPAAVSADREDSRGTTPFGTSGRRNR